VFAVLAAGQVEDIMQAPSLLQGQIGDAALADKACDGNAGRAAVADMRAEAAISSNRSRRLLSLHDASLYKHRRRIERCFDRPEHVRCFAARCNRRSIHFDDFLCLSASMIWLR